MEGREKRLIIWTDIGDTIIDEGTEQRGEDGIVTRAECIPGARETYLALHRAGFRIVMVADGLVRSFRNTMRQHGLDGIFSAWIISEEVGADKPDPRMFRTALQALSLTEEDRGRIIMVGNNVLRDIRGAGRFGVRSVLMDWSRRRPYDEELPEDHANFRIHTPAGLLPLALRLEAELG